MNLSMTFAARKVRMLVVLVAVSGWITATVGALAHNGRALGGGLILAGASAAVCTKALVELSATEARRPAPVPLARLQRVAERVDMLAASAAELRLSREADHTWADRAFAALRSEQRIVQQRIADVAPMLGSLESATTAIEARVAVLEDRIRPSRRFTALSPGRGRPRELGLSESLEGAVIPPFADRG